MAIEDQRNFKQPQSGGAAQRLGGVAPSVAPRATAINQIPGAEIKAPPSDGRQSSELSRNLNNAANALGGMGAVASVPLRAGQAASKLAQQASGTQLLAGTATKAAPAADFISGMGSGATTYANTIPRLGNAPTTTLPGVNAALQEGAQANAMAAATRLGAGAGAGANALDNGRPRDAIQPAAAPKQAQPPAQEPPSARGLYFADRAQDMSNRWNSGDYAGAIGSGVRTAGEGLGVSALSVTDSLTQPWRNAAGRAWDGLAGNQPNTPATAAAPQSAAARLSEKPNQPAATQAPSAPEQTAAAALPNAQANVPQDWSRQGMSNAQVAQANPQGRVQVERQANGTTAFSGGNVSGPVSYTNSAGVSVPGAGINGQGFGGFESAPAGANVGIGAGGYGFESRDAGSSQAGAKPRESWSNFTNRMVAMERGQLPGRGTVPQMARPAAVHSGNDWNVRQRLRSLGVAASSIAGTRKERAQAQSTYQQAKLEDLAAMTGQSGLDTKAMEANAGLQREGMSQEGANTRTAMGEYTAAQRLALDTRRLAGEEEAQGFQMRQAQMVEDAQKAILNAQTDEARTAAQKRLSTLTGKNGSTYKLHVTPQTKNLDGSTTTGSVYRLDETTGDVQRVDGGQDDGPVKVTTEKQLIGLPAGTVYVGPDGKEYRKN